MATLNLADMLDAIQAELGDTGVVYTDAQATRALTRALRLLSSYHPEDVMYDHTVDLEVADEVTTSAFDAWVALTNSPLEFGTDVVTNVAGTTTYTRDTDYKMDYMNGKIMVLSTGTMADTTAYHIDYYKHPKVINISALTDILKFNKVAVLNAAGDPLTQGLGYERFGDHLRIKTATELADSDHLVVYYKKLWSLPGVAGGTWPEHWDEFIMTGAKGYLCHMKAAEYLISANVQLTDSNDALDKVAVNLTASDTSWTNAAAALAAISTAITQADDAWIAAGVALADITTRLEDGDDKWDTDTATPIASIEARMDAADDAWTDAAVALAAAVAYLLAGDDYITTPNKGGRIEEVSSMFAKFADKELGIVQTYLDAADKHIGNANATANWINLYLERNAKQIQSASIQTEHVKLYLERMARSVDSASVRIAEVKLYLERSARCIDSADGYIGESIQRNATGEQLVALSRIMKRSGDEYLQEFKNFVASSRLMQDTDVQLPMERGADLVT